jgi:hypothetical protein
MLIRPRPNGRKIFEAPDVESPLLTQKQSTTRRIARPFALSKFAFPAQTALSSALFRSAKQTESCNASPDSAISITILSCQTAEIFGKTSRNQGLNPGEAASPDSLFPSFRPGSGTINSSGEQKGLSYEDENVTHSKFDEPLACTARFNSHSAAARLLCAFAHSVDADTLSRWLRHRHRRHFSR